MEARVAAVRVETQWDSRRPLVRCEARLTRVLTPAEARRLRSEFAFDAVGDRVTYVCRPEESEVTEKRLSGALAAISRPAEGTSRRRSTPSPA